MEQLTGAGALPVSDLSAFLEGDWELTRTINDVRMDMPGSMSGTTAITRQPDKDEKPALTYREEGLLCFGNYKETVHRIYEYCFPETHKALVLFSDGRMFHELDLSSGFCQVEHLCVEDTYLGRFRVESPNAWLSNWYVSGPSKELILDNRYQRLG